MTGSMTGCASYKKSMTGCHSSSVFLLSMTPPKLFPPCEVHHHWVGKNCRSADSLVGHDSMSFPLCRYKRFDAKHSLKQNCLAGLRPFWHQKLLDPQKCTFRLYNKYVNAKAVARTSFEDMLDVFAFLFSWLDSKYLSVSKSRLCS